LGRMNLVQLLRVLPSPLFRREIADA
jgi:hypothetical protein